MAQGRYLGVSNSLAGGADIDYDRLAAAIVRVTNAEGSRTVLPSPLESKLMGSVDSVGVSTHSRVSAARTGGGGVGVGGAKAGAGAVGSGTGVVRGAGVRSRGPGAVSGAELVAGGGVAEVELRGTAGGGDDGGFGVVPASESGQESGSERSSGSVSGGRPDRVSDAVRSAVSFGALDLVYTGQGEQKEEEPGYCALTSTKPNTKHLAAKIKTLCGFKVPKTGMLELGISTYAAGAMPAVLTDGVRRLRSLASIGDAAITLHLVTSVYKRGETVASAQSLRSKLTSDHYFCRIMNETKMTDYISYPAGVHPESASTTATAFEAMVGVMVLHMPVGAVAQFLRAMKVIQ